MPDSPIPQEGTDEARPGPARSRSRLAPIRFADMTIGRKLIAIVILCVGFGFMVMIGVQITGTRADLHKLAFRHSLQVTALLANSVAGGVRWQQPDAVERAYEPYLTNDIAELAGIVALDIEGRVLATHESGLLPGVDLEQAILDASEALALGDVYSLKATDHIIVVTPVLIGRDQAQVGTLAVAWGLRDLNALISANLDRQGILAGFSLVALIVVLLALLTFTVSHPLRAVSDATMRLAQGDRSIDVPEAGRGDEIGEMARALEVFKHHIATIDELTQEQREHAKMLSVALEQERKYSALHREFVAMASHEFRTPLAIIDGAAQRMIRRAERMTADELRDRVGKVRHAVSRMIGLIDSTLSASRMEAGQIELELAQCSLHEILETVCRHQQEIAPEHDIRLAVGDAPDHIVADPKLLEQIFTNLVSNAVKYSPQKGPVDIGLACQGQTVGVSVRDSGVGIPSEELPKLFERFFRASTSTGIPGTGIGLNLVRELVHMHGGSVHVQSAENAGSTFTVCLPVDGPGRRNAAVPADHAPPQPAARRAAG